MSINNEWVVLAYVPGDLQAEILRGLLEAQGVPVFMSQESAGRAIGLTIGPLGEVTLLVRAGDLQEAQRVLADYRSGIFENEANPDQDSEPDSD